MKLSLENKITNGFILSLLILISIAIVSYLCIKDLADDAHRTKQSEEVIAQLTTLLFTITEAETAQRGYIITGNNKFLESYKEAIPKINKLFRDLKELTSENKYHQKRIKIIDTLITNRLTMIKSLIDLRRTHGFEIVQREIASGKGRQLQIEIHNKIANMQNEEYIIQKGLEQNSVSSIRFTKSVLFFGSIMALLFVCLALIIIRRGFVERRLAESEIKMKNFKNSTLKKTNSFLSLLTTCVVPLMDS
jgi:CHASE3 domain sensor protein